MFYVREVITMFISEKSSLEWYVHLRLHTRPSGASLKSLLDIHLSEKEQKPFKCFTEVIARMVSACYNNVAKKPCFPYTVVLLNTFTSRHNTDN